MSPPLHQRLEALRRRVRWLVLVHGVCLLTAGVLGALIVLGALDYIVRFQDRGLRLFATLGFFAVLVGCGYRYLYLPGRVRLRDEDLAFHLQRRFPVLRDRLASAVEFMRQEEDDPMAGSPVLRRIVIAEMAAQTETLNFPSVLDGRPPRRAAVLAGTVALLALAFWMGSPTAARTAVARLLNPFSNVVFPQTYHLTVKTPVERVARGGQYEIEIVDENRRPLPREIRVFYRIFTAGDIQEEETLVLRPAGESVVVRRENVLRPFAYRLEGGDDRSMSWQEVAVVEPPAVAALSVKSIPPAYTGWPVERSPGDVRALVGTHLEMTGRANKPLRSARLDWEGDRRFPASLTSKRLGFTVRAPGLIVTESGEYGFTLEDTEGIAGGENDRWKIEVVPDAPPTATFTQPAANLYVTPQAVVPLRLLVKDDLALHSVSLAFQVKGAAGEGAMDTSDETYVPLYVGPEKVPPQAASLFTGGGQTRTIEYRWALEPLRLRPAEHVEFAAVASDYRPQTGRSNPRKLILVTPRELQDRLSARQSLLLGELERVLKIQQSVRTQVEAVRIRWDQTLRIETSAVDQLRAAELSQRQATLLLSRHGEGIPHHVENLLAAIEMNRLEIPELKRRLEELSADLRQLQRGPLPAIARELTAALKSSEIALDDPPAADLSAARRSLQAALEHQAKVIATLESWIARLSQWESSRRFQRALVQLQRDQEETARRTAATGRRTLARDLRDLPPSEVAELRILAARQGEHARVLDRLLQEMQQALPDLRGNDPPAAESVADAVDEARRQGTSGRMRACGDHLQRNQIGQATQKQKEIARQLQELLDILARRRTQELEVLVKKLRRADAEAAELERQQAELQAAMMQNAENPDTAARNRQWNSLAEAQRRLGRQTEKLARRLERLQARRASQFAQQAVGAMGRAGRCAAAGEAEGACGQADAARKALAQARRQLDPHRRQAELQLAMERLARLEDAVKHLQRQQQKTLEDTQRLEQLRQVQGQFTRAQAASVHDLARLQGSLESDTKRLAEDLGGTEVFAWTLTKTAADMAEAAARLGRRETGPAAQRAERSALARLTLLVEAVKPEPPEDPQNAGGAGGGGQQPPGHAPRKAIATLAELKLLRLLQQELNGRTAELHHAQDSPKPPTDVQRRALAQLAEEQGRLAEMVFQLLPPTSEVPEENVDQEPLDELPPD